MPTDFTARVNTRDTLQPNLSVASMVKVELPVVCGVPPIVCVDVLKVSPAGSDPVVIAQV